MYLSDSTFVLIESAYNLSTMICLIPLVWSPSLFRKQLKDYLTPRHFELTAITGVVFPSMEVGGEWA